MGSGDDKNRGNASSNASSILLLGGIRYLLLRIFIVVTAVSSWACLIKGENFRLGGS